MCVQVLNFGKRQRLQEIDGTGVELVFSLRKLDNRDTRADENRNVNSFARRPSR